jgi:hypothetical protein
MDHSRRVATRLDEVVLTPDRAHVRYGGEPPTKRLTDLAALTRDGDRAEQRHYRVERRHRVAT